MEQDRKAEPAAIRVLVADNSRFHAHLLIGALSKFTDLQVFRSELRITSLLTAFSSSSIDVLILSAFGDDESQQGLRMLEELREVQPGARALILLDSSKTETSLEAFRSGARGVFDHQGSTDALVQCIRKIHSGQLCISNDQMALVLNALVSGPKVRAVSGNGLDLLSKREAEVVRNLADGLTNREIGLRLGLSQHTIKNHLFRIFDKLGVSNRIELMFMTLSQGSTTPPALLQVLQGDASSGCDEPTLELCERAAENGVLAAQLMLARIAWSGEASNSDLIRAYMWYGLAVEQLISTKNTVKKSMKPAQLAEAEGRIAKLQSKVSRIKPRPNDASLAYGRGVVA